MQKSAFPFWYFLASLGLLFGPLLLFSLVVTPLAETSRDPDAVEFMAWFATILATTIGIFTLSVTVLFWQRRRVSEPLAISGAASR
jgi:hypothetical protein